MRRSVTRNVAPHLGDMNQRDWSWMRGQTWQPLAFESGSGIFPPLPAPAATLQRVEFAAEGCAISFPFLEWGGVVLPILLVCQVFPRPEGLLGGARGLDELLIQAAEDRLQALKLAEVNVETGAGVIVLVQSCPKRAGQRGGGDGDNGLSALVGDLR